MIFFMLVVYGLADLGLTCWLDVKMNDKSEAAMQEAVENSAFIIAIVSDGAGKRGNAYAAARPGRRRRCTRRRLHQN